MPTRRAFTLAELLVVFVIILIVIAALTPAMFRASKQADLARCAAYLHGVGTGILTYAMDHKRYYPDRRWPDVTPNPNNYLVAHKLADPTLLDGTTPFDLRPKLSNYLDLNKVFNDPFTEPVDLTAPPAAGNDTHIYGSVALWAGWRYVQSDTPRQGMEKLGDRFEWVDAAPTPNATHRFDLLASDVDVELGADDFASHPDDKKLASRKFQNAANSAAPYPTGKLTVSEFFFRRSTPAATVRDPLDLNFSHDDGSVRRFVKVTRGDGRMVTVDAGAYGLAGTTQLPAAPPAPVAPVPAPPPPPLPPTNP